MDDLFGQIECRSKLDSVVMRILRSAMDKAHEKVQCEDGPIEFLHARSTFYELAAILVESGLYIVKEEMEFLEGSHDKVLADLLEIKYWLQGRIKDMKHLIIEKDRQLMEKLENESKLRQALEMREEELAKLSPGKVKDEGLLDFPSSTQAIQNGSTDGDISKLKSSLDQQVWNIKQKLEDEEKIIISDMRKITSQVSSPDLSFEFPNEKIYGSSGSAASNKCSKTSDPECESSRQDQNVLIKRMSSDIDILKETLDLAFGKLQRAEVLPLEKQWRCTVEKDIEHILMKGFMSDLQPCFDLELRTRIHHTEDNWADFVSEMKTLCYDLKAFCSTNDAYEQNSGSQVSTPTITRTSSESSLDFSCTGKLSDEENETSESRYVAKLIKNHESIIEKQSKGWKWLTRDVLRRKSSSNVIKINGDHNVLERRIQGAITRLENLIKRNHKFGDNRVISNRKKIHPRSKIPTPDAKTKLKCASVEILEHEIEILKEERDVLHFHISSTEETYRVLLQGMIKDAGTSIGILEQEIEKLKEDRDVMHFQTSLAEETYQVLFQGVIKDVSTFVEILEQEIVKLKEDKDAMSFQISSAEETYQVIFNGIVKDARISVEILEQEIVKLKEDKDVMSFQISSAEETYQVLFNGIVKDACISVEILEQEIGKLKEERDFMCFQISSTEETYQVLFQGIVEDIRSSVDILEQQIRKLEEGTDVLHFQIALTEGIYQVLFQGVVKDVRTKLCVEREGLGRLSHTDSSSFERNSGKQCNSGVGISSEDSSSVQVLLHYLESSIREDVHTVFLRETFKEWNKRHTESRPRFRRCNTLNSIDVTPRFRRCDTWNSLDVTPRSRKLFTDNSPASTPRSRKLEADGEESFIQKLDSLARCLEAEEDLMLKASSEIKKHSVNNSLVISNCEEVEERDAIEWLLTDDESMFTSVSEKLERALQQLYASKELLFELEESLEESDDIEENDIEPDESNSYHQQDEEKVLQMMLSENVLVMITQFQQALKGFEQMVHDDLNSKCLRVKGLKRHIDSLIQPVALIKSRKLLYKKAFVSRCHNLKLAESEVDLLGDQVETLLRLLQKIYVELNQNARILSQYFGVFDMLKLIRTELNNGGVDTKS